MRPERPTVPSPVVLSAGGFATPSRGGPASGGRPVLALAGALDPRSLTVGSRIEAIVCGRNADGSLRLLLAGGEALLRVPFPLEPGRRVTLSVSAVHPQLQATLQVLPQDEPQRASWPPAVATATHDPSPALIHSRSGTALSNPPAASAPAAGLGAGAFPASSAATPSASTPLEDRSLAGGTTAAGGPPLEAHAPAPSDGNWLILPLPLPQESGLSQIRLLARHLGDDGEAGARDGGRRGGDDAQRRFTVEATPPALGSIRLDALLPAAGGRLELVLRSVRPLPPALRDELRQVARRAGGCHGLETTLAFHVAPPTSATSPPAPTDRARGLLV